MTRARTVGALLSLPLALGGVTAAGAADPCGRFAEGVLAGTVEAPLTEISGVAASTRYPGVLWAHDDSGGAPAVTAIGEDGADLGAYELAGARAVDWEDVAVADGTIYVGDIGDNRATRSAVTVYRAPEPAARPDGEGGRLEGVAALELRYPGGPVDAEALLVDPVGGDLYVLTKEAGTSQVLRGPAESLAPGRPVVLEAVGRFGVPRPRSRAFGLPGTYVTGADVAPDGSFVLVRTYRSVLAFSRAAGAPLHEAFDSAPCEVPQIEEGQGEAVAVLTGGDGYVTIAEGEGAAVHRFGLRPSPPSSSPTSESVRGDDGSGDGRPVLALVAAVAVAGGLAAWWVSRRRAGRRRTRASRRP